MDKLVYIKWVDSGYSLRGDLWQTKEEIIDLITDLKEVETIGFLLYETKDWIVLGQSLNLDMVRGGYIIYKKNIIKKAKLLEEEKMASVK